TEDLAGLSAGTYDVTVTDANGCTATESVEVTEPTAIVVDVVVDENVVCNGGSTGAASVTATGGTAPFELTVNGTTYSNLPDNTTIPVEGLSAGTYPVNVTDGNGCTATESITITEPAAIVVDVVVDTNVSCFNGNDGSVTINLTNGVAPFEYTINGTTWSGVPDASLFVDGLSVGTYPINIVDANGCTATGSVEITEPAEVMPPTADAQVFCNEGTVGDLVAEGTDVLWYDVETGGTPLDASTDLATATYYATQTVDGCESPTRTAVDVTVNVTPAPSASAQVFCNEAMVSDLVSSGTDVLWYDVATGGEALASDAMLATGTYYVSQTLNECESASRTAVSVTVNVTPAPTADAQVFCNFGTVGQLEATGDNIQWYASETAVNPLASTANLATGTYYVTQTMNDCESPRAAVEVTVNVTPAPAAIAQVFCNEAVVSDLVATGEGTILWYTEVTGGTALEGDVVLSTGTYYASQVINECESAARVAINVTVNVTEAPTAEAQVFCSGAMVSDLAATGTALLWYADETGGEALASDAMLATGTYYVSQTMNDCESPRTAVDVTVNVTEAPTAEAQEFCNEAMVSDLIATGDNIQWYADETGGEALVSDAMLATGTYYVSQTMNDCESPRTAVDVTVNVVAAPVAEDQTICTAGTVADLVATGDNVLWYADETTDEPLAGDTVLLDGTTYYASQTVGTCESTERTAVMVTITMTPAPTGDDAQIVGENATFADLVVDGTDIVWYASAEDAANHENALDASTILVDGVTYYATQTVDGCESVDSLAVTVTVSLRADVFEANKLTYYPVPVVDVLNVENNNMITSVTLINMMGQVVLTQEVNATTAKIDMRSLQGATYIMQVETETGVITVKVVKNSVN
ncbi:Ig-like domain-containing protein, partial [Flavobacterium suaedae]|uniref:Ig-like domain-containing protein n=1 Tax=Flavobacterium suaedae TaxID=1767027 RepID=UPI00166CC065